MASNGDGLHGANLRSNQYNREGEFPKVSTNILENEGDENEELSNSWLERQPIKDDGDDCKETEEKQEMGVRECFVDFCRQTILHGWHYLVEYEESSDDEDGDNIPVCPTNSSPKENYLEKRGHLSNHGPCHQATSNHNIRNRHLRQSTSRVKNTARDLSKRPYHSHQNSQYSVPKQKPVFDDSTSSTVWEENGKNIT